jgi:hypothetical protein
LRAIVVFFFFFLEELPTLFRSIPKINQTELVTETSKSRDQVEPKKIMRSAQLPLLALVCAVCLAHSAGLTSL